MPLETSGEPAARPLPWAEALPPIEIEPRRREMPLPPVQRRTPGPAGAARAEAAFSFGQKPSPGTPARSGPPLLAPSPRTIVAPEAGLRVQWIPFAPPRQASPPPLEPVQRIDVLPAPAVSSRSALLGPPNTEVDPAGSIRAAIDAAQKTRPSRLIAISRALTVLWLDVVRPALATGRGKAICVTVAVILVLAAGMWGPRAPLRLVVRAAAAPMAVRAYFALEDNFSGGLANWTGPDLLQKQDDGLVVLEQGLTLYRPSLSRSDYNFNFAGVIRKGGLGWLVRAADAENYHALRLTWRGRGKERRSVLVRYAAIQGVLSAEKVVAMPFEIEENKVYNVEVSVHGDRNTTVIDGRGVDSFADSRLASGGVGFLAEAGDVALLHSLSVEGNDDTTGRLFAWVLGFGDFLSGKLFGS